MMVCTGMRLAHEVVITNTRLPVYKSVESLCTRAYDVPV
jgi:hypothetical protein